MGRTMSSRLVHDHAASPAQPSRSPNRTSTARTPAYVTDTQAADTQVSPGVGGHSVDWWKAGAILTVGLFVGGFWSALGLILAGLELGACLFALPAAIIAGVWLGERWWPDADLLGHAVDGDEQRVRTELYPGGQVEAAPRNSPSRKDASAAR